MSAVTTGTIGDFQEALADRARPVPASVSAASVAATFGLSLAIKVLEITLNRKDFAGDARQIREWVASARHHSEVLTRAADKDVAAYREYLDARRQPGGARAQALRNSIEVPLRAARSTSAGIDLCEKAAAVIPDSLAADLGGAMALLSGSLRAILISIGFNLRSASDAEYSSEAAAERNALAERLKRALENLASQ